MNIEFICYADRFTQKTETGDTMNRLTIYRDNNTDTTLISNRFIDEYMKDANDAQLKVYLYLLRLFSANLSTSVSDIADQFNHTEKDVIRALKYWEKNKLLSLDYNDARNLVGIHLKDLTDSSQDKKQPAEIVPLTPVLISNESVAPKNSDSTKAVSKTEVDDTIAENSMTDDSSQNNSLRNDSSTIDSSEEMGKPRFVKPTYSLDQIKNFSLNNEISELIFIAEQYIGKTISSNDMKCIIFFKDVLGFSTDLIDYLIQYCVDRDKKDFRYIESVAISWAEQNITTPKQAAAITKKYDKTVYTIMRALGKQSSPSTRELDYIKKWTKTYCFTNDIIIEACDKTVMSTDSHRFEYADSILANWYKAGFHTKADIKNADKNYQENRPAATASAAAKTSTNKFNQFSQRSYDYEALEKEILSN